MNLKQYQITLPVDQVDGDFFHYARPLFMGTVQDGRVIETASIFETYATITVQIGGTNYAIEKSAIVNAVFSLHEQCQADATRQYSEALEMIVLQCPIPAGMGLNEHGQGCDLCAQEDPHRAAVCRQVNVEHWSGTIADPEEA